jgi:tetratricopeptide (TPR) repeat protein
MRVVRILQLIRFRRFAMPPAIHAGATAPIFFKRILATMKYFFLLPGLLFLSHITGAQSTINEQTLLSLISNRNEQKIIENDSLLLDTYINADSSRRNELFLFFDQHARSNDAYTSARSLLWKGIMLFRPPLGDIGANSNEAMLCMQQGVNRAVESDDEYLMVECFDNFADNCRSIGKPETALFYYLKSAELREKINTAYIKMKNVRLLGSIGELLFQMQEYKQAIHYIKATINLPAGINGNHTSSMNTLALAYQKTGNYDSALYWYGKSLESAIATNDKVWTGIVSGNTGSLYFETGQDAKALPLLWKDYYSCREAEPNNAANTLHRIALIYLRQQKTDSALLLAKEAVSVLRSNPHYNAGYTSNGYKALSEIYRKTGMIDSAFYYAANYHRISDSLNQAVARNRLDVVQTKLEFEKTSNNIGLLVREKRAEQFRRNVLLASIFLLLVTGWFYFRWQKQRHQLRQRELLHQKEMAETEMKNARTQLDDFTRHNIRTNELIEQLQEQLVQQNTQATEALLNQTILTETDWLQFKDTFDKAHPGFMSKLKEIAPGITTAEIRLATLTRLNIGNKHIASMLGIGTDAVRKTKSRLRQRLQLPAETDLDEYIKGIHH